MLANEGYLDKIVLLRGYKDLAVELQDLDLPELNIDGLFMTHKLLSNTNSKISTPIAPTLHLQDAERFQNHYNRTSSSDEHLQSETQTGLCFIDPSIVSAPSPVSQRY